MEELDWVREDWPRFAPFVVARAGSDPRCPGPRRSTRLLGGRPEARGSPVGQGPALELPMAATKRDENVPPSHFSSRVFLCLLDSC